MISDANVVKADIACSNGIIHVIDRVILPSTDDLIELAAKTGSFETLAAAIKTAARRRNRRRCQRRSAGHDGDIPL